MKKGLSILLVLTLLASMLVPVPVFGTAGNTLPGEATVGGTGGITTLGTAGDVLGGRLPTTANLNFTIDPRNLLEVEIGQVIDIDARNTAVNFGENDVLVAYSTSSVETLLTVALQVTATGATPVLNEAAITSGDVTTANNILLWMEPSASYVNVANAPFAGLGQVVPYGTAQVPVQFRLQARAHDLVRGPVSGGVVGVTRVPAAGAPALYGTAFRFGGIINAESNNWGNVTELGVTAVFTIARAEGTALAAALRTDGDVTEDSRMIVSHGAGAYVAPSLIPVPEGVATGSVINTTVSTFVEIATGISSLNGVRVRVPGQEGNFYAANHTNLWFGENRVVFRYPTAGRFEVLIFDGTWQHVETVTVVVSAS